MVSMVLLIYLAGLLPFIYRSESGCPHILHPSKAEYDDAGILPSIEVGVLVYAILGGATGRLLPLPKMGALC